MNPAEAYILNQTEPYQSILLYLQSAIERTIPDVQLKFKWNIPCFYCEGSPICYLNAVVKKGYVDVGFWNSAHFTKYLDQLVCDNRKVVRSLRYRSLEEIDNELLIAVLQEAYSLRMKGFYKKK